MVYGQKKTRVILDTYHLIRQKVILSLNKFSIIPICIIISSCSYFGTPKLSKKSRNLTVHWTDNSWHKTFADQSDYAYLNKLNQNYIVINSTCRKYITSSLKQLTNNILAALDNSKILKQEYSTIKDRESLITTAKGNVDGKTSYIHIITLKKNRCIYDFMLISKSMKFLASGKHTLVLILNTSEIK